MKKTFIYLFLSALALMLGGCGLFGGVNRFQKH
jgi:hypothetical protein